MQASASKGSAPSGTSITAGGSKPIPCATGTPVQVEQAMKGEQGPSQGLLPSLPLLAWNGVDPGEEQAVL